MTTTTTPAGYTAEEWQAVLTAPILAGLYISTADVSGVIGMFQEAAAVPRLIIETAKEAGSTSLVHSIAEALKAGDRPQMPTLPRGDLPTVRTAIMEQLTNAVTVVRQKAPAEADGFRNFLVACAHKVAEAAKEGGFLGFGGELVSADETKAISDLSAGLAA